MSATFSEIAADVLVAYCASHTESAKYLISELHSEGPESLYAELLLKCNDQVSITLDQAGSSLDMSAIRVGSVAVVPFLVISRADEDPSDTNRGTQAFNGKLRDWFDRNVEPGGCRILVTLDANPIETQLTAMDTNLEQSALSASALIEALRRRADVAPAVRSIVDGVSAFVTSRASDVAGEGVSSTDIASLAHLFDRLEQAEDPSSAGAELGRTPWLLSDPEIGNHPVVPRLGVAAKTRSEIEGWAKSATSDFEAEVRTHYSDAVADQLIGASSLNAVDTARFSLPGLTLGRKQTPPRSPLQLILAEPVRVQGRQPQSVAARDAGRRVDVVSAFEGDTVQVTIRLTRPLQGTETVHLFRFVDTGDGHRRELVSVVDSKSTSADAEFAVDLLRDAAPGAHSWTFLSVALSKTKTFRTSPAAEVRIALLRQSDGRPRLVYERGVDIDLEQQAFAIVDRGTIVDQDQEPVLRLDEDSVPSTSIAQTVIAGATAVPVLARSVEPVVIGDEIRAVGSKEHFELELHAQGQWSDTVEAELRVTASKAKVSAGANVRPLQEFPEFGRWRCEAEVLNRPEVTAYTADESGVVAAHPRLDSVEPTLLRGSFEAFMAARKSFFGYVVSRSTGTSSPSVLTVPLDNPVTTAYVDAYYDLLEGIEDGAGWTGENERILMMDAIERTNIRGSWLVGPTHPFHVASHLELQRRAPRWVGSGNENLLGTDVAGIGVRWLVPFLRIDGRWHESAHAPYLWRRYSPVDSPDPGERGEFVSTYIERRIRAFLAVHHGYRDRDRRLTIALLNPGSGEHVLRALRRLIPGDGDELDAVPTFELILLASRSAADLNGAAFDRFMTETMSSEVPSWRDEELMRRLIFTKRDVSDWVADPTSFAHISFAEGFVKPGDLADYRPGSRPSTMYVDSLACVMERQASIRDNEVAFVNGLWSGPGQPTERRSRAVLRANEVARSADNVAVEAGVARGLQVHVRLDELDDLYARSAWVVHLDRHVGLELFRTAETGTGSRYILDYSDQEDVREHGLDGVTATSSVGPYLSLIRQVFASLAPGVAASDRTASDLLGWLNVLSGRWALELIRATPTEVKEKLASVVAYRTLMATEFSATDNSFSVVLALDELLRISGRVGLRLEDGWVARFGDEVREASDDFLILTIGLRESTPLVIARVVEVKYRSGQVDHDYGARQVRATSGLLAKIFGSSASPGSQFRGRELARLIWTHLGRLDALRKSNAPALFNQDVAAAVDAIARGAFSFQCTREVDGQILAGDLVTVEPHYPGSYYVGAPIVGAGEELAVGRTRIGAPQLRALGLTEVSQATEAAESAESPGSDGGGARPDPTGGRLSAPADETNPPHSHENLAGGRSESGEGSIPSDDAPHVRGSGAPALNPFAVDSTVLRKQADVLDEILSGFRLPVQPIDYRIVECGPNLVRFKLRMERAGTIGQIEARARDIQREMASADPILIGQDPPHVTLDLPRLERVRVSFADLLPDLERAPSSPGKLPILLGRGSNGEPKLADLAQLPHLLVAGTTGSGKSVFLTSLLACLVGVNSPQRLVVRIVDIKGLDFAGLEGLPHLDRAPVESADEAIEMLDELIRVETTRRRALLRSVGARQITEYYERESDESKWPPQIVVFVDEYAQILGDSKAERAKLESLVQQYAQFARAFGIYLVLATQRPSVDIVTGPIKANLPARCVFRLPAAHDSRTVIDAGGAESLLGHGDMLFYNDGSLDRVQTPFTSPEDVLAAAARFA